MKRWLYLVALVMMLAALAQVVVAPAQAQGAITVTSDKFVNKFRQNLLFQLEAQSSAQITQIALYVQFNGIAATSRQIPTFTPGNKVQAEYEWRLTLNYIPPGSLGQYWWTVQDSANNQITTPKQSFQVDDPAHKWQKLSNDRLALYWYAGGDSFGKSIFDRANQSMDFLQQDTGVQVDTQVQMLIYGSHDDLLKALAVGANEWTGGENFPDYGVVVIGVEPGNLTWGLGAVTHELTHQVIHQKVRGPLGDIAMPHWMDEGLAVYYQDPGKVDAQFQGPLRRAIQNNTLMPLRTLENFPADSAAANLAYGESWSVVDFIIRHYGKQKLTEILQGFKKGEYFDDVFMQVLGVDTDGLENAWRKDVGAPQRVVPTRTNASPTPFPTFGLSTDSTPSASSGTATSAPADTATLPPVALNATPLPAEKNVPPALPPASSPATPATNLCGGVFGIIALGIFGATRYYRRRKSDL